MLENAGAAFRARAKSLLAAEIDWFITVARTLAKVEFDLELIIQLQARRERPALLAAKAVQGSDELLGNQLRNFLRRPVASVVTCRARDW